MLQQFYPVIPHPFKYELNKDMNFSAAHYIPHPDAGGCAHMHGHTYFANITVAGNTLDHMGFLVNFQDIKKAVHKRYDHTVMNDHAEFDAAEGLMPSTENVAAVIFGRIEAVLAAQDNGVHCVQVIVRETPTSYVIYRNPKVLAGELA